jgi:hypothetical protein
MVAQPRAEPEPVKPGLMSVLQTVLALVDAQAQSLRAGRADARPAAAQAIREKLKQAKRRSTFEAFRYPPYVAPRPPLV